MRSAARPNPRRRSADTARAGARARARRWPGSRPPACRPALNGPCSPERERERQPRELRDARAGCPASAPVSSRSAASTVRRSCTGRQPRAVGPRQHPRAAHRRRRQVAEHEHRVGARVALGQVPAPARRAPAAPPLPPLVETSVSVRSVWRPPKTRASSSSAAVPDSSASAGLPAASRCATTTIPGPGRARAAWRRRVSRSRVAVDRARRGSVRTRDRRCSPSAPASGAERRAGSARSTLRRQARRRPRCPGRRSGNCAASPWSVANALAPSKASGASVVWTGRGRSTSENAATTSASRSGANAARYNRGSSTLLAHY